MPNEKLVAICIFQILSLLTTLSVKSQNPEKNIVRFMFYNVENLFDVNDDTLKDDDEFLPGGVRHWNSSRYEKKINSLYKTIVAAGEWSPPEVVAFCEAENRNTIESIIYGTYLSKYNYRIIHEESADIRGIDVCLIYRQAVVSLIDYKYWIPADIKKEEFKTRSVLYAKMAVHSDTIHVIVNHWPSRRGGVLAGEDLRMKIASMVRSKVDSLYKVTAGNAKVIILGDFNSTPDDTEIKFLTDKNSSGNFLINLAGQVTNGSGTYRYHGIWEMIDQIIVSESLLSGRNGLFTDMKGLNIFRPDFLITKDPNYPGDMPFSTYRGYRYYGGTSDHLPVILNVYFRNPSPPE